MVARGEVEDTTLKAKDSPSEDRPFRGEGPNTSAIVLKKKGLQRFFSGDLQKRETKKVFPTKISARLLAFFNKILTG